MVADAPAPDAGSLLREIVSMRAEVAEMVRREQQAEGLACEMLMRLEKHWNRMRDDSARLASGVDQIRGDLPLGEDRILAALAKVQTRIARDGPGNT
ncbi:hypothetical protein SAMN05216360_1236 [Methylobacterium phyllostachyos]|uniref:Uncharacterized protein n=1 Tax=Methylobacterium phyllostachyos TaxID=582672 RepID=A0A1H0JLW2_9HYPH|nr:hypothetical protein [Methylobacterium phyllostachyos]SDO44419.1 hypothetical protein SAMN05216360_1236 [Methylobacterium phyllostachyos]